jgi:hypothetical protein
MPTTALRAAALLAVLAALACSGKKDAPPAATAAPTPAGAAPSAPAPAPANPELAFARTLTEDKLARLIAFEHEILPITAELVGGVAKAALAAGGDGQKLGRELSRDERTRQLGAQLEAAQKKHGITGQDQAGLSALTTDLVVKEMFATEAREQLAANEPKKAAWAKAEAEYAAKKKDPRAPPYAFVAQKGTAPLPEIVEQQLREQVRESEAARRAFAEKYGQGTFDVVAKRLPELVLLRQKQMDAVMRPK